jgi:penicillin-binding protein 2
MSAGNTSGQRSGSLVESHTTFQPRVFIWYFVMAFLLLVLASGLAYQQLMKGDSYHEVERMQTQRRILTPGPRGNIYDREGRLLVGNKARFAVVIYLDELRREFRNEYIAVRTNYRAAGDKDIPTLLQMERIARTTVVQRYLSQANSIIGRNEQLNIRKVTLHFERELLLPYTLINDLTPEEYAKLIERLPVSSPLQVHTFNTRDYPNGDLASQTLGFVGRVEISAEDFPGDDLPTSRIPGGSTGRDGLELQFDATLQGEPGGTLFRVDPAGYRINPPIAKRLPVQGKSLVTSLDLDLQQAAEESLADQMGAAVMLDVNTGEVLVLASKPSRAQGEWINRALSGLYPPGSTFKLITSLAGLREGSITPESTYFTDNTFTIGKKVMRDHAGCISGQITFELAIEKSVNTYFYNYGIKTGVEAIAAEGNRFGLNEKTGIELPNETERFYVGTPELKKHFNELYKRSNDPWTIGDTANLAIGQGYIQVTPLQMACFVASLSRGETRTKPTILHQSPREHQHSAPIGINPEYYRALIDAMEKVIISGTGRLCHVEGLRIAGKTGTAQKWSKEGIVEFAWFVGFAPIENPEVAFAVLIQGDKPDESYGGGVYAAPVAQAMLQKWHEKRNTVRVEVPNTQSPLIFPGVSVPGTQRQ